jgi:hypothetical protein
MPSPFPKTPGNLVSTPTVRGHYSLMVFEPPSPSIAPFGVHRLNFISVRFLVDSPPSSSHQAVGTIKGCRRSKILEPPLSPPQLAVVTPSTVPPPLSHKMELCRRPEVVGAPHAIAGRHTVTVKHRRLGPFPLPRPSGEPRPP